MSGNTPEIEIGPGLDQTPGLDFLNCSTLLGHVHTNITYTYLY